MAWYNNFMWFACQPEQDEQAERQTFYCANPQCRQEIRGDKIAYEPQTEEVTHGGECQSMAIAYRVMNSGGMMIGNFDILSRKQASSLVKKGRIAQRSLDKTLP